MPSGRPAIKPQNPFTTAIAATISPVFTEQEELVLRTSVAATGTVEGSET